MRILLIQSYLGRKELPVLPLGLAYLTRSLQEHEVSVIDPNVEADPFGSIREKLANFKPDAVGISLRNIDATMFKNNFYYYKMLAPTVELIKELMPNSCIIIGGAGFSLFAEEIMHRNLKIDFGVYLEAEDTFPELLKNLSNPGIVRGVYYRQNGKCLFSGLRELPDFKNALIPKWELLDLAKYQNSMGLGIQSKRGCCLTCAYCTYPFLTGKNMRLRPPDKVVDEIEMLNANKDKETPFLFADPVFNIPKWHAVEICKEMIKRDIKTKWSAYFSLKGMDEDFIRLAYEAGCRSFICSPDAYSDSSLSKLRKEVNKEEIKGVYQLVSQLRLKDATFDFSFFISAPGQHPMDFISLIWLKIKTNLNFTRRKFLHISLTFPRILPHTELYEISVREGIVSRETSLLPLDEKDLTFLFYRNPKNGLGEGIYMSLLKIKDVLKNLKNKSTADKQM